MEDDKKEKHRRGCRERYYFLKEHGICVMCGQENAVKGKTRCLYCQSVSNESSLKSSRKHRNKEAYNQYMREYRRKRKEEGLCQWCGKPVLNGYALCNEHLNKKAAMKNAKRREQNIIARSLMGDGYHCYFCGKDVEHVGEKLCPVCLERIRKWSAEQRKKIDYKNHRWKKDNDIVFRKRCESELQ